MGKPALVATLEIRPVRGEFNGPFIEAASNHTTSSILSYRVLPVFLSVVFFGISWSSRTHPQRRQALSSARPRITLFIPDHEKSRMTEITTIFMQLSLHRTRLPAARRTTCAHLMSNAMTSFQSATPSKEGGSVRHKANLKA